jgi:hypothetical protein
MNRLAQLGLPVWLDRENLDVGDRWEHAVRDSVDECAAMIIMGKRSTLRVVAGAFSPTAVYNLARSPLNQ